MYCNRCGTFDEKASLLNHRCSVKLAVKPEKIVSAPVKPDNVPKKKAILYFAYPKRAIPHCAIFREFRVQSITKAT